MISFCSSPESLFFSSTEEWQLFCQEVGGIVPVYFWNGKYTVICEEIRRTGEHGAVMLGDGRNAITHYVTPGGVLSHHWEAFYGKQGTESRKYWSFVAKELPQEIDRGEQYWLRSYRQSACPGLYEAVTKDGVPYPLGKSAVSAA